MENQDYEALFNAVRYNNLKKLKDLIEHGIDLNATDKWGDTALMYAARTGNVEIVKYLADNPNIDLNAKDEDGKTALMHAALNGHLDTVKYLYL